MTFDIFAGLGKQEKSWISVIYPEVQCKNLGELSEHLGASAILRKSQTSLIRTSRNWDNFHFIRNSSYLYIVISNLYFQIIQKVWKVSISGIILAWQVEDYIVHPELSDGPHWISLSLSLQWWVDYYQHTCSAEGQAWPWSQAGHAPALSSGSQKMLHNDYFQVSSVTQYFCWPICFVFYERR